MKKIFLILSVITGLHSYAENFPYLTFETTEGQKVSVASAGLEMSISDNVLTVGQKTFTISNLKKMYFSCTNESSGIREVSVTEVTDDMEIYDLRGNRIQSVEMKNGIYLLRVKNATYKIAVK